MCIFLVNQLKTWTTAHLHGCGWYLDCGPRYTHPSEVELRQSLHATRAADVVLDDYAGLEESAKQKAILKRQEEGWKKEEKLVVDAEKAASKEMERKLRLARRVSEKEAQKSKGKKAALPPPSTEVQSSPQSSGLSSSPYSSLTLELITYRPLLSSGEDISLISVAELILHKSVEAVLDSMGGSVPSNYSRMINFYQQVWYSI